jgi:4-amino-4-deoxy-L-arabinose transferase-like glycosyltransferase
MASESIASADRPRPVAALETASAHRPAWWAEVITLLAFCAFFFFYGLGSFGLLGADEPRYAQVAREMLARHDWVVPTINGIPWLEKPALYYWGAMLSYSVFGVHDWAARVPSALLATLMIVGIYAFTRRFRLGAQLDAALIAASAAAMIGFARGASTDMPLTATFTLGMLAWYTWFRGKRREWLAAFYFAMALATLAKGPVAPALAGAIILPFALLRRDVRLVLRTLWWPGILLFLAVAGPWYALVEARTGQFFRVFLLEHTLMRFGTNMFQHHQPIWYYLPVLLLLLVPWTVFALKAIGTAAARVWKQVRGESVATDPLPDFLLLWLAVPLVVFSISHSKLPGYILPGIPAAALLLAYFVSLWRERGEQPGMPLILLHAGTCGALTAAALLSPVFILKMQPGKAALLLATVAGLLVAAGVAVTLRSQGLRMLRFVTLIPVVVGLAWVIRMGAPAIDVMRSARPVSAGLEQLESQRATLATYHVRRELQFGLNFYRDQPIASYDGGEVPAGEHLLVAPTGSLPSLQSLLPERRFSRVGGFPQQRLEYYWVSMKPQQPVSSMGDMPGMEEHRYH